MEQEFPLTEIDLGILNERNTDEESVLDLAAAIIEARCQSWFIAFRSITNATNERTAIFCVLPQAGVANSAPIAILSRTDATAGALFTASLSSFAFDFVAHFGLGGTNFNFFI